MSGLLALVSLDGRSISETLARGQLAAIASRGEMTPRLWRSDGIALGHVNLPRTPEAERERLPGCAASGRYWLTWDGRLDNREELARALGIEAPQLRELTDADMILEAYERWGDDCVHQLVGDWAIVIWDAQQRRLFCARDPLGWRPLFYAQMNRTLAVGSEVQQIFAGGLCRPDVNREYVLRYLGGALQEPGETCYAGIRELEGGQSLSVSGTGVNVRTYWDRPPVHKRPYRRPEEYVEEFAALSRRVVKAQLRSNRPLGIFLSGGLDSSYVAAQAASQGAAPRAITAYVPGSRWLDERPYARAVVDHLGLEHREVDISDCWALSSRWLADEHFDQPGHPPQSPLMIRFAQTVRDVGAGVVFTGEGGDDWIDGRESYLAATMLHGRLYTGWKLARRHPGRRPAWKVLFRDSFEAMAPISLQDRVLRLRHRESGPELEAMVRRQVHWQLKAHAARTLAWRPQHALSIEWRLRLDLQREVIAWQNRHALKPACIEMRNPLNDRRIVELMASTPEWIKRFNGRPRDVLREAGYRLLPRAIFDREDKAIFNELVLLGLCSRERSRVHEAVKMAVLFPGVRREVADSAISQLHESRPTSWRQAWGLITTGLWLQSLAAPRSRPCASGGLSPVGAGGILTQAG